MKCLYDQWMDGEAKNISRFQTILFQAMQCADGTNRNKLKNAFPDWFRDSEYL